jgi:hypothetical protein
MAEYTIGSLNVVIVLGGKLLEVNGLPDLSCKHSDIVKVDLVSKGILA